VKLCLPLVALLFAAAPARAHEVLHAVERGKAVAVKAYFADGEALAYTEYQVFSPADRKIPYQKGRTDRAGYLAFVPDPPGKWRVVVTDSTGHGLDIEVDAGGAEPGKTVPNAAVSSWAFAVRPVVGVLVIGALFALLVFMYRRKKS
jgi:nickel transport protein